MGLHFPKFCCWILVLFLLVIGPGPVQARGRRAAGRMSPLIQQFQTDLEHDFINNDYKGVIVRYRKYTQENPNFYVPLVTKAYYSEALAYTGDLDEAIEALRSMIEEVPAQFDLVRMQYNLANLLSMENRQSEARVAYQKVLLLASDQGDYVQKAKDRLNKMKEKEVGRKDKVSLELYDLETLLEAGAMPDGAEGYLKAIMENDGAAQNRDKAKALLERVRGIREQKVRAMLNEARRLYDEQKKYAAVKGLLEELLREFPETNERHSVEILLSEVKRHLPAGAAETVPAETFPSSSE